MREPGRGGFRHVPAVLLSALFLVPLWLMVTGSLRPAGLAPPRGPELIPPELALDNYGRAFELVDMPRYTLNSLIVVAFAVPITLLCASWAGFAMTRLSRRAQGVLVGISLISLMVPATAMLVSRFALFRALHLTNTFVPLVAPAIMGLSPFYVLLFYWSFRRLPGELFEAARLEGLGPIGTWWRVAMPLVRPVTVAVGVLAFAFVWSDFLGPLIFLFDERLFTVPLGLRSLRQLGQQDFPLLLAGAVVATAPVVVGFLFVQRFFLGERRWLGR